MTPRMVIPGALALVLAAAFRASAEPEDYFSFQGPAAVLLAQEKPWTHLHQRPKLEWVALNHHEVTRAELDYICGLKNLRFLDLGWGPEGIQAEKGAFEAVKKAKGLLEVTLVKWALRDEDLAFVPHLPKLEYLSIEGEGLAMTTMDHFTAAGAAHLVKSPSLLELEVRNFKGALPDEFVSTLADLSKLEVLRISSNFFVDEDAIARLSVKHDLRPMRHFSDSSVAILSRMPHLEVVHLSSPRLTAASLRDLTDLPCLRDLSHSAPEVGPADLAAVSKVHKLESLRLPHAALDDATFKMLAGHPNLRELHTKGDQLTVASKAVLASLPKLDRKKLSLPGAPLALFR